MTRLRIKEKRERSSGSHTVVEDTDWPLNNLQSDHRHPENRDRALDLAIVQARPLVRLSPGTAAAVSYSRWLVRTLESSFGNH